MADTPKHVPLTLRELFEARWPIEQKYLLLDLIRRGGRHSFTPNGIANEIHMVSGVVEGVCEQLKRLDVVCAGPNGSFFLAYDHPVRNMLGGTEAIELRKQLDAANSKIEVLSAMVNEATAEPPAKEHKPAKDDKPAKKAKGEA